MSVYDYRRKPAVGTLHKAMMLEIVVQNFGRQFRMNASV